MRIPLDKFYITQLFGARPEYYQQFGLKHHEGLDLRTKNLGLTSWWNELMGYQLAKAAEEGICTAHYGHPYYGTYVDLVSAERTWRYAHLKNVKPPSPDSVIPGSVLRFRVKEGDSIGITGNSGNSQAPHLHLMQRPHNFDVNNGTFGWEDPLPLFFKPLKIAFVNQDPTPIVSKIKEYLPREIIASTYQANIVVPSGTLNTDRAMQLIDALGITEPFVFIYYPPNPDSAYEVASVYPQKNIAFCTIPQGNPLTIPVHAFLHLLRKHINMTKIEPYIEDVERYPTSWSDMANFDNPGWAFKAQYEQLKNYLLT